MFVVTTKYCRLFKKMQLNIQQVIQDLVYFFTFLFAWTMKTKHQVTLLIFDNYYFASSWHLDIRCLAQIVLNYIHFSDIYIFIPDEMAAFKSLGKITASSKAVRKRKYFESQYLMDRYTIDSQKKLRMFRVQELENVGFKF